MYSREPLLLSAEVNQGHRASPLSLERGFVVGQMRSCGCGARLAWPVSGAVRCGLDRVLAFRLVSGATRDLRFCLDTAM